MENATALVTYLLSASTAVAPTTSGNHSAVAVTTATVRTTAASLMHHTDYQGDAPQLPPSVSSSNTGKRRKIPRHPHMGGHRIGATSDRSGRRPLSALESPLTGVIVIGSVLLFITMSITATVVVFCRKRNTVFVFNKSEHQPEEDEDDSDLELDNLSVNLEEWAALSLASSSMSSLNDIDPHSLYIPRETPSHSRPQNLPQVHTERELEQDTQSTAANRLTRRQKRLLRLHKMQMQPSQTGLHALQEMHNDQRGAYSKMVVSAVVEDGSSDRQQKNHASRCVAPQQLAPSQVAAMRLAQHRQSLKNNFRRLSQHLSSIVSESDTDSLQSADTPSEPPSSSQPPPPPRRPWNTTDSSATFSLPNDSSLRVEIQVRKNAPRTVQLVQTQVQQNTQMSTEEEEEHDKEAVTLAALISPSQTHKLPPGAETHPLQEVQYSQTQQVSRSASCDGTGVWMPLNTKDSPSPPPVPPRENATTVATAT